MQILFGCAQERQKLSTLEEMHKDVVAHYRLRKMAVKVNDLIATMFQEVLSRTTR